MKGRRAGPILDLRTAEGALDPLARYKMISIMAWPRDAVARKRFRTAVRRAFRTGVKEKIPTIPARLLRDGAIAGDELLYRLQLHQDPNNKTFNSAISVARAPLLHAAGQPLRGLPRAEQLIAPDWHRVRKHLVDRVHRKRMLDRFREWRSVAHFWATMILAEHRPDLELSPEGALPRFVAASSSLAEQAAVVQFGRRKGDVLLPSAECWTVRLPGHMATELHVRIPPVSKFARTTVLGSTDITV